MGYIDIKDLSFTYMLSKKPAVSDLNLSLERGKFYAVLGANGSGKTTLCNIIRGFVPRFFEGELAGEVLFDGALLSMMSMGELSLKMGYVFQNPFNQITGARDNVYEEIAFGLENFNVPVDQIRERVERIMEMTNTSYLADKNPLDLSGGQQQRVALASILVMEPDTLIIDEPTSQLDPVETARVFDIIEKMKEMGKTIVLVEHKIELVAQYADDVIVLEDGKLIDFGEKHEVLSKMELLEHGVTLPQSVILADKMRARGIPVPGNPVTRDELKAALVAARA